MRAFTTLALIASLATLIAAAPVPNPPPGVQAGTAAYVQACLDYFADSDATVDTEPLNKRHPISVEACYDSLADDTAGHVEAAQFRR